MSFIKRKLTGEIVTLTARHLIWQKHEQYARVHKFLTHFMKDVRLSDNEMTNIVDNIILGRMKFIGSEEERFYLMEDACNIQIKYSLEIENLESFFYQNIKNQEQLACSSS